MAFLSNQNDTAPPLYALSIGAAEFGEYAMPSERNSCSADATQFGIDKVLAANRALLASNQELRRSNRALNYLNDELSAENAEHSARLAELAERNLARVPGDTFPALLVQELRSPLCAIANAAYVLDRVALPDNATRSVTSIGREMRRITRFLDSLTG